MAHVTKLTVINTVGPKVSTHSSVSGGTTPLRGVVVLSSDADPGVVLCWADVEGAGLPYGASLFWANENPLGRQVGCAMIEAWEEGGSKPSCPMIWMGVVGGQPLTVGPELMPFGPPCSKAKVCAMVGCLPNSGSCSNGVLHMGPLSYVPMLVDRKEEMHSPEAKKLCMGLAGSHSHMVLGEVDSVWTASEIVMEDDSVVVTLCLLKMQMDPTCYVCPLSGSFRGRNSGWNRAGVMREVDMCEFVFDGAFASKAALERFRDSRGEVPQMVHFGELYMSCPQHCLEVFVQAVASDEMGCRVGSSWSDVLMVRCVACSAPRLTCSLKLPGSCPLGEWGLPCSDVACAYSGVGEVLFLLPLVQSVSVADGGETVDEMCTQPMDEVLCSKSVVWGSLFDVCARAMAVDSHGWEWDSVMPFVVVRVLGVAVPVNYVPADWFAGQPCAMVRVEWDGMWTLQEEESAAMCSLCFAVRGCDVFDLLPGRYPNLNCVAAKMTKVGGANRACSYDVGEQALNRHVQEFEKGKRNPYDVEAVRHCDVYAKTPVQSGMVFVRVMYHGDSGRCCTGHPEKHSCLMNSADRANHAMIHAKYYEWNTDEHPTRNELRGCRRESVVDTKRHDWVKVGVDPVVSLCSVHDVAKKANLKTCASGPNLMLGEGGCRRMVDASVGGGPVVRDTADRYHHMLNLCGSWGEVDTMVMLSVLSCVWYLDSGGKLAHTSEGQGMSLGLSGAGRCTGGSSKVLAFGLQESAVDLVCSGDTMRCHTSSSSVEGNVKAPSHLVYVHEGSVKTLSPSASAGVDGPVYFVSAVYVQSVWVAEGWWPAWKEDVGCVGAKHAPQGCGKEAVVHLGSVVDEACVSVEMM